MPFSGCPSQFPALRRCKQFADVNAPKFSCCGLRATYPLQEAAREKRWHMVLLLVYFGADAEQKDGVHVAHVDLRYEGFWKCFSWICL